jgi:V-type H+-transporting ATPase subunit H
MKPLTALRARTWADDELAADLENLGRALARSVRALTSFEEYKKEVLSGELDWTPPHKSETFWHENVQQFDEDDFRLVKTLKVLASGDNTKVASIACYDLGEFARLHPRGRDILDQTGGKAVLIGLMSSAKNVEVQKQALFAIQKLMVKKFDMIAS